MLSFLVIHQQLAHQQELLAFLLAQNATLTFTNNTENALSILGSDHYAYDAVIIDSVLAAGQTDFVPHIRLHHAYKALPIIAFGATSVSSDFMHCASIEEIDSVLEWVNAYKEHKPRNRYLCGSMIRAEFSIRTLKEAHLLANLLSAQYPEPEKMFIGISELLINAVEHGNLGITFDEKSALLAKQGWFDEIDKRLEDDTYRHKKALVVFERVEHMLKLMIEDEGDGFDWRQYGTFNPRQLLAQHGRGIMMAKAMSFSRVNYNEKGNCVFTEFDLDLGQTPG